MKNDEDKTITKVLDKFWWFNPKLSNRDVHKLYISYNDEENKPTKGGLIVETTSEFPFDNLAGVFSQDCNKEAIIKAIKVAEDYTHYDANKCRNGGDYGFDFYEIVEVIEVEDY